MSRTAKSHHILGRLRVPILALLAGVGFVVQGAATGLPAPGTPSGERLSEPHAQSPAAFHPATGLPGLVVLEDGTPGGRGPRARTPQVGGADPGAPRGTTAHGALRPSRFSAGRVVDSPESDAPGAYARAALQRAGRSSAPSTAPPVPSF